MLYLGSAVAGEARGWVAGRAGLWGVTPTWVWVVGTSPQVLEHPTSICDTGVNISYMKVISYLLNVITTVKQIFWSIYFQSQG